MTRLVSELHLDFRQLFIAALFRPTAQSSELTTLRLRRLLPGLPVELTIRAQLQFSREFTRCTWVLNTFEIQAAFVAEASDTVFFIKSVEDYRHAGLAAEQYLEFVSADALARLFHAENVVLCVTSLGCVFFHGEKMARAVQSLSRHRLQLRYATHRVEADVSRFYEQLPEQPAQVLDSFEAGSVRRYSSLDWPFESS